MKRIWLFSILVSIATSASSAEIGPWEYSVDLIDDTIKLWTAASDDYGPLSAARLIIEAKEKSLEVSISWGGNYFNEGLVPVITRFDLDEPQTTPWLASGTTGEVFATGSQEEIAKLFEKLKSSWRMVVRTTIWNGNQFTLVVDLHGLSDNWIEALAKKYGGVKTSP